MKSARAKVVLLVASVFPLAGAPKGTEPSVAPQMMPAPSEPVRHIALGDGVEMTFVLIPAGSFSMGSDEEAGDGDESPVHAVRISRPFYFGRCEVTQAQWEKIMGANPGRFISADLPVDSVSWNDAQVFVAALSRKTGHTYALPTEAQWEYACRAGTTTPWSFGGPPAAAGDFAWWAENADGRTHVVETKKPNPWGLYDMHGNVWEWCADWYAKHTYSKTGAVDPRGPAAGESRVLRGGAWGDQPDGMRSATRNCNGPDGANDGIGLRVVLMIPEAEPGTFAAR
jgi:formylglycine-generating enzyme required for sulfatase activity